MKNRIIRILVIFMFLVFVSIIIGKISVDAYEFYDNYNDTRKTSFGNISVGFVTNETAADTTETSRNIYRIFGAVLTIVQVLAIVIASIMGILSIKKYIYIYCQRIILRELYRNSDERKEKMDEIKRELLKKENKMTLEFFIGIFLLLVAGMLNIIKNFAAKPIIYLYPEKEQKVIVKLKHKEKLTCTYPKYKDGWEVIAKPNGELTDCETGRKLYALYWEGKNTVKHNLKEGFIVKGEDSIKFLEEKLAILGLNEREAEEFIVYWLPKLESNKYNFIRFETMEEIEENMPLEIEPKPDTIIRVMMVFKKVITPFEVVEPKLESPERNGFTVVEWGGTEL